jgi:predicted nuclease of predicted toxin-antitoxin system
VFAKPVGLGGRSDEEIFAYAWREKRIIWTHDRDFLDDKRFPVHRNPGVLVLPAEMAINGQWALHRNGA